MGIERERDKNKKEVGERGGREGGRGKIEEEWEGKEREEEVKALNCTDLSRDPKLSS